MKNVNDLIDEITSILTLEKSYDLPSVCMKYGLESGDDSEAFKSKRVYVQRRLKSKDQPFLIDIAKKIVNDYGQTARTLQIFLRKLDSTGASSISEITRRYIMKELYSRGNIEGDLDIIEFLNRIWDLDNMPSQDFRFGNASDEIWQHIVNNSDYSEEYLYTGYLDLISENDDVFMKFLEQVIHPLVRPQTNLPEYIGFINYHLMKDGYQLVIGDNLSGYPIYKIGRAQGGVNGTVKNLIFAAIGEKPEIIFSDSINNDIKIVKHENNCLVYDRPIPSTGLYWNDLVNWWKDLHRLDTDPERSLYRRLYNSLDSHPEKILFRSYFKFFMQKYEKELPALIPQVYLHYDPYTIKQRLNKKHLQRQRMDFLLLFSNKQRVVIEIDGKQHYSDGETSSPKKYSEMVSADRDLKLNGYEVYRFGGYELMNTDSNSLQLIEGFFERLFRKHSIKI